MLPISYFQQDDVVRLARELVGCLLVRKWQGQELQLKITETEAYRHYNDLACHAANSHRTPRNAPMFESGGRSYVYLCYGIHHMFNIVTNVKGKADAILIRALEPLQGEEIMIRQRNHQRLQTNTTAGPGNLTQATGITRAQNNILLNSSSLHIIDKTEQPDIEARTRIGIGYAGEDTQLPWRFYDNNSPYVSKR